MSTSTETADHGLAPDDGHEPPPPLAAATVLAQRPRPSVEWVEVEGEVVAWEQGDEALHLLDPVASLVFRLSDGVTPLDVTAQELAEAYEQPVAVVEPSVLGFAAELVRLGLVEVVR